MYQMGKLETQANALYLVAALPAPVASSASAQKPAKVVPVRKLYVSDPPTYTAGVGGRMAMAAAVTAINPPKMA